MNFSTTEEQDAVRELSRQIFTDACTPERLTELERDPSLGGMDDALWQALADAHLLGVDVSEAHGGSGYGFGAACVLLEEAGRALAPVPLLASLVYAAPAIERFGTGAQKKQWLPGLVSGEIVLSGALEELGNADPARPLTRAAAKGEGWVLEGEKACVPQASRAARILVPATLDDGSVGIFLVDPSAAGVELEEGLANNHERLFQLTLAGAQLSARDRLGGSDEGTEIVQWIVDRSQTALAALQLGICESALRKTAEYTTDRKQFGRPIGTFQAVSMRLADAFIDLECMKSTLWQAIWRLEEDLPTTAEAASAKWWACRGGSRVAHTAMHLHGGIGADIDYPIHRHLLWAQQLGLTLGGAGQQLAQIGARFAEGASGQTTARS